MRYWWAMLAGAVLGMSGCQWEQVTDRRTAYYPLQGISTYKGQSVAELWDDNGAPNIVKNMDDGAVMWVYYTNYRPARGGEIIPIQSGGERRIAGREQQYTRQWRIYGERKRQHTGQRRDDNRRKQYAGGGKHRNAGSEPEFGRRRRADGKLRNGGELRRFRQRKHCGRRIYRGGTERFGRKQCCRKLQRQGHFAQRQGGGSLFRLQLILTVPVSLRGGKFCIIVA